MRKEIIEIHNGKEYIGEVIIEKNEVHFQLKTIPDTVYNISGYVQGICIYGEQTRFQDELLRKIPLVESRVREQLLEIIKNSNAESFEDKLAGLGYKNTTHDRGTEKDNGGEVGKGNGEDDE